MPELKDFPLPDAGEGLTEADILTWHVAVGDTVAVNQIVVEIETAKAAVELPCPWAGVITALLAEPGETVEVGSPILRIDVAPEGPGEAPLGGEGLPTGREQAGGGEGLPTGREQAQPSVGASAIGEPATSEEVANLVGYGPAPASAPRRRARSSVGVLKDAFVASDAPKASFTASPASALVPLAKPPVRKLAKDLGVDLRELIGSGSGGVITRKDVQRAAAPAEQAPAEQAPAEPAAPPAEQAPAEQARTQQAPASSAAPRADAPGREHRVPIRGVRKATAAAMVSSAFTVPHVTEFLTVDVTPIEELRHRLAGRPEFAGVKLSPLALAAKALCLAARRTPEVNAAWDEDAQEIVYRDYIHLGVAAATPRGLVVPKVREAQSKSLPELAAALGDLTEAARAGSTPPADMVGGTITITNVGVFGVDTGTPIITPGESAILAFGAIREAPWVVDGQVVPRKVCQLAVSFDHRLVDGAQGSRFLADIGAVLADPGMALAL